MDRSQAESRASPRRRGFSAKVLLVVVPALVAVPAIAWNLFPGLKRSSQVSDAVTCLVERGDFVHVITERGNVESAENEEIRCEVQSLNTAGTRILKIVSEGTKIVRGGPYLERADAQPEEPLVVLDSSALVNDRMKQESAYNASLAALIQAQSVMDTAFIASEEYFGESLADRNARRCLEAVAQAQGLGAGRAGGFPLARFRLFGNREGKFFLEENTILSEIDVAQENLRRARDTERYSEQLQSRGYITRVQLEADHFARQKAEKDLEAARKKLEVLQNYTRRKMEVQLQADIDTAKAKCDAAKATYNLDESKLKLINEQITKCTIKAKKPGQVVYANITERFGQETIIEEGTLVRERQVIIRLPNPEKMQVKVKVNEAKVALVGPGMPARIRLDAYSDAELEGVVESVGEYPAPGMWWAANVKEYDTIVKILKSSVDLRPGYTADVTILIARESDVLLLPVQAVIESGGENYCVVRGQSGFEARNVKVGPNNDEFVVVRDGLDEGDAVVSSPALVKDKVDLPEAPPETMARTMLAAAKTAAASKGSPLDKKPAPDSLTEKDKAGKGARPPGSAKGYPAEIADQIFKKLDTDGDGKLKADDLPAEFRKLFAKADLNHDDFIDRAEFAQIAAAMTRRPDDPLAKRPPNPPAGMSGGAPGGTSGGGP